MVNLYHFFETPEKVRLSLAYYLFFGAFLPIEFIYLRLDLCGHGEVKGGYVGVDSVEYEGEINRKMYKVLNIPGLSQSLSRSAVLNWSKLAIRAS